MKITLVFDDWRKFEDGRDLSVYQSNSELSYGNFHSGTVFHGEISLAPDEAKELQEAIDKGFKPVFYLVKEDETTTP